MPLTPYEDLPEESRNAPMPESIADALTVIDATVAAAGIANTAGLGKAQMDSLGLAKVMEAQVDSLGLAKIAKAQLGSWDLAKIAEAQFGPMDLAKITGIDVKSPLAGLDRATFRPIEPVRLPALPKWKGDADRVARDQAEYLGKIATAMEQQTAAAAQQLAVMQAQAAAAEADRKASAEANRKTLRAAWISAWAAIAGVVVALVFGFHLLG